MAFTPWGPPVMGVVGVLGYVLLGVSVIDVSKDLYMSVATTLGARSDADFDKAAQLFSKGISKAALDAGMAAAGFGVTKAVQAVSKAKKAAALRADGKVEVVPPPAAKPPARNKGTSPAPLPGELGALRASLVKDLGEAVVGAVTSGLADDAAKLASLRNLEKVVDALKAYPGISQNRKLYDTPEKMRALLTEILEKNGGLLNIPKHELISDFAMICELEGAISTIERLAKNSSGLKGVVAEVQETARMIRAEKKIEAMNRPVVHDVTVPKKRGGKPFESHGTDIDIIAEGTLWQVKVGPSALNDSVKFEAWILQAMHYSEISPRLADGSRLKIGLKLDIKALEKFNTAPFKGIWDKFKAKYPELGWTVDPPIPTPDVILP